MKNSGQDAYYLGLDRPTDKPYAYTCVCEKNPASFKFAGMSKNIINTEF